ncbi:MAG: discoidin domain-containing protein [Pyrinomonadaceae bacterium]|nr:discoidin domain-containing protein [Sphingobacteriaceae bacterium]
MYYKKTIILYAFILVSISLKSFSQGKPTENLALFRPVSVSSTDHAPTPPEFAVDGEYDTGWRARLEGIPQWLSVDLQASCKISDVILFSEANQKTPFRAGLKRSNTLGDEIFSSYPRAFRVEVSDNGVNWQKVFETLNSTGGEVRIKLQTPINTRIVRVFITEASNSLSVGINEVKILGECSLPRPEASGWTKRRKPKVEINNSLTANTKGELFLDSGWELTRTGWDNANDGKTISSPSFNSRSWYNATVPGTVVTTLVDQEVFAHPSMGLNNLKIPESLCRYNWWYRRSFKVPDNYIENGSIMFLELGGINQHANIWLNGQLIGNIPSAFLEGKFNISNLLKRKEENVLAIEICPMSKPGVPGDKGPDGNAWVNAYNLQLDGPTYLCSSGWDWMPAMRDRGIGILGAVNIKKTGKIKLLDSYITSDLPLPDTTSASIFIEGVVENLSDNNEDGILSITFDKRTVSQTFKLKPGEKRTIKFSPANYKDLMVKNPKLWWPNGYGQPNLYNVKMEVKTGNVISDVLNSRLGIREITYNTDSMSKIRQGQTKFELTNARFVRVNCLKSLSDHFALFDFSVSNTSDITTDLAVYKPIIATSSRGNNKPSNANDGNAVSIWVSGSGSQVITVDLGKIYPINQVITGWGGWDLGGFATNYTIETSTDSIKWQQVAAINEKPTPQLVLKVNGINVFCKGGNWGLFDVALKMPKDKMRDAIRFHKELGFTMIRNWMGNTNTPDFFNYCDEAGILIMNDFWAQTPNDKQAYIEVARENIKRFRNHPSLAFWCGSNESHPKPIIDEGLKKALRELDPKRLYVSHSANDQLDGFGPYTYNDPKNYYYSARGFKSEIGLASVPVYETVLKMTGDKPVWPINEAWYYHDYTTGIQALKEYVNAIESRFGRIKDAEDYANKAQFINYENLRAIFEAANHKVWNDCSAVLLWMTQPAWYSTAWQLYDYDYEVGGAWAGSKKACEPIHIQATLTDWKVDVVNYTSQPLKGYKAKATVYSLNGKQIGKPQVKDVSVKTSDKTYVFDVNFPRSIDSLQFLKLELTDPKGRLVSDNFYWKHEKPENLKKLYTLNKSQISGNYQRNQSDGTIKLKLKNTGNSVGAMIRLSVLDESSKERILPAFYSDNYFWMLPGEVKTISIGLPAEYKGKPLIKLSGMNQNDVLIN